MALRMMYNIPQSGSYVSLSTYLSLAPAHTNMAGHVLPESQSIGPDANQASGENNPTNIMSMVEELNKNYASLHVGGLSKDVGDGDLYYLFCSIGLNVVSVRVCRDVYTKGSLGYGYANFVDHGEASFAIDRLNYTMFHGKPVRLAWSVRDKEKRESCVGKLYLKNLAPSIGEKRLYEIFSEVGRVVAVKVARKADRTSLGYGYVQFDSQELADEVMKNFNDIIVERNKLLVTHYVPKSGRKGHQDVFNNLYIKNIEDDFDEMLIRLKFSQFGPLLSVKIEKDVNGRPKGFGFVCFEKPEHAKEAMEKMNGLQLGNKTLYVAKAMKKAERALFLHLLRQKTVKERRMKTVNSNVYVKEKIDDTLLNNHFSQCGTITSAKVMCNDRGISKGFGFVCYSSPEEAQKAIATFNHQFFHGRPLYVAMAETKEERRARLQQYFAKLTLDNNNSQAQAQAPTEFVHAPLATYQRSMILPTTHAQPGYASQQCRISPPWPSAGYLNLPSNSSSSEVSVNSEEDSPPSTKQRGTELHRATPDSPLELAVYRDTKNSSTLITML